MDEVVELQNVEGVCRLCLSGNGPMSSVFGTQDSPVSLAAKIQTCLSIQISVSDKLSTRICAQCVKNVNKWQNYKEVCLKSQVKLQQWLEKQTQSVPLVVTIKDEPIDLDFDDNIVEVISNHSDRRIPNLNPVNGVVDDGPLEDSMNALCNIPNKDHSTPLVNVVGPSRDPPQLQKQSCSTPVKPETHITYDTDNTLEMESGSGTESVLNPFARRQDITMEADSTELSNTSLTTSGKKKMKRGPHTHFRGIIKFRKKCQHCQIHLHSKHSYANHMKKFHSDECQEGTDTTLPDDEVEAIEDVEDELVTLENESPLTQVQENIIGQLKTFSCYTCGSKFSNRKSTLIHIRQHMPDLRPFTCIACLTEFADRSLYKRHCGSSFECAMKIALVVPKQGQEQYFTCNMCLRTVNNRDELLNHLTKHTEKQFAKLASSSRLPPKLVPMAPVRPRTETVREDPQTSKVNTRQPYMNGDPLYNNTCDLCGMIYKHKSNMLKHRELCARLSPEVRTSYTCAHCAKTFLVFKKFHGHLSCDHKSKTFPCAACGAVFTTPKEFLVHFETHRGNNGKQQITQSEDTVTSPRTLSRSIEDWDSFEAEMNSSKTPEQKFTCALCSLEFATRGELVEHRHIHLKVKIYSCVICRSMFSSASALEVHMKDHGVMDSSERNNSSTTGYERMDNSLLKSEFGRNGTCRFCGKKFANEANARRHEKTVHANSTSETVCAICSKSFATRTHCANHVKQEHSEYQKKMPCPYCSKTFVFTTNLKLHIETDHKCESFQCSICGKLFMTEISMKKHRATHSRYGVRNGSRSLDGVEKKPRISMKAEQSIDATIERPAKARKSFPNPPPPVVSGNFECQVCHGKFADVTDLRKHLWDIHCARNKPEKLLTENELQCDICSEVFSDKETLKVHVEWHKAKPILSDISKPSFTCSACGKNYASQRGLQKHRKVHEASTVASIKIQTIARKPVPTQFMCTICRRVFTTLVSLQRHRINFHGDVPNSPLPMEVVLKERTNSISEPRAKKMKLETDDTADQNSGKKPVMCHLCKKTFPNLSILYRHKQQIHKKFLPKQQAPVTKSPPEFEPITQSDGTFSCNICKKNCFELSHLRRHNTLKHLKSSVNKTQESNEPPTEQVISQPAPPAPSKRTKKKRRVSSYSNLVLCCTLCDQHFYTREAMSQHIKRRHNANYNAAVDTNCHREVDITTYAVDGVDFKSQECPHCRIRYPNFRVLKVHYFRFHEGTA